MTPQKKYDLANTKTYTIKVVKTTEKDIMDKLDSVPNKSQPLGGIRPDFSALGLTKLGEIRNAAGQVVFPGISILVPIALVVLVIIWFVLNKTVFGKNVYAIGGNREAARGKTIAIIDFPKQGLL